MARKADRLSEATGLGVYPASVSRAQGVTYFLARRGEEKLVGCWGQACLPNVEPTGEMDAQRVCVGPTDATNAAAIRKALRWTTPRTVGLETSFGFGDRLGLATPGHLRALKSAGQGLVPVLAQQSIREMSRTHRTPQQVMDAATWGVLQEGWRGGFGSDADHLQKFEDIDATVAAGFTLFTIDPGAYVDNDADALEGGALAERYGALDFEEIGAAPGDWEELYAGRSFALDGGGMILFDEQTFQRAAVKYGGAIVHTIRMFHHLRSVAEGDWELEISVDETETPTTPAEHFFFASELGRLGVSWVSLAPRFVGRFEKGVDYLGDLAEFRRTFAEHVAVMRTLGPYKLSVHSGSDKFAVYPIVAELAEGLVHVKTAGTSYLEALRAVARAEPGLFREILRFALDRYERDKATYHVSARPGRIPLEPEVGDAFLPHLLDQFDARQVLHVTYGSVLSEESGFRQRLYEVLRRDEEAHYEALTRHLARHVSPFATA